MQHTQASGAFFEAIRSGDVEAVRRLIAAEPGLVDAREPSGLSAVLTAIYHRRRDVLKVLVARGAALTLAEASAAGELDRVDRLLHEGADVHAKSADGWTPLHLAAHFGHVQVAERLLAHGADIAARSTNPSANTPLHAALAGRQGLTAGLLIGHGADVNAADAEGWRPVHLAIAGGHFDTLKVLVQQGADLSLANAAGLTALELATQKNDKEAIASVLRWMTA